MMRVLIAEGASESRKQIVEALAGLEAVCVNGAVADVDSAMRAIGSAAIDCLVTGVELADGSGLDLITAAQALAPPPRILVIGKAATREVWRSHLAAGADRFVEPDAGMVELREVVAALAELEQRKAQDNELRVLGRMAVSLGRELSSRLSAMQAALVEIEKSPRDRSQIDRANACVDQTTRLLATLLPLLDPMPGRRTDLDFGELVRQTMALLEPTMPPNLVVKLSIADGLQLRGNAVELVQMVLTLVLDAVDAMGDRGELTVRAAPAGTAVYFDVSDTAVRKVPPSRCSAVGLVSRIVDRHGGAVAITSRRDGPGTVITMFL